MTASSWPWVYRYGMRGNLSGDEDARRKWFGIEAIKSTLVELGYVDIHLGTGQFGGLTRAAVKDVQKKETAAGNDVGPVDGIVGRRTANALFRGVYGAAETANGVPRQLLRAHCHWESGDDPGAELTNSDDSRDRGLTQANNLHDSELLSDEEAFDPEIAVPIRAASIASYAKVFAPNTIKVRDPAGNVETYDHWDIAVSAHRTPLGAKQLAAEPDGAVVEAKRVQDGGTWEQAAAYYCWVVNTGGRLGWVG